MKPFLKYCFYLPFLCLFHNVYGQNETLLDTSNSFIYRKVFKTQPLAGIVWWKCDSLKVGKISNDYLSMIGLDSLDSLVIKRTWQDNNICLHHNLYQQYFNGVIVEGAEFREHYLPNGNVVMTNSSFVEDLTWPDTSIISESQAIVTALDFIDADTFLWEDDSSEYYLKVDSLSDDTTYYPKGELVYTLLPGNAEVASNYILAWKFRVRSKAPFGDDSVYIHATADSVFSSKSEIIYGDFNHIYYGTRYLDTRWIGGIGRNKYYLYANDNGRNIRSKDGNWLRWNKGSLPNDDNDHWNNGHWAATSAHFVVQEAWEFYRTRYNQFGLDGNNKPIRVAANHSDATDQAFYTSDKKFDYIGFGVMQDHNFFATIDIGGHEFTHGVNKWSGPDFEANSDPGSINESFADIFGVMVERFVLGSTNFNWTIAENAVPGGIRDLSNPSSRGNPEFFAEPGEWNFNATANNGGTHNNSSVHGLVFHFLSVGGSHRGTSISAIGMDDAADLAYFVFKNIASSRTTYPQLRELYLAAAKIIYGDCSFQSRQVCNAFHSINIGPSCSPCTIVNNCWSSSCQGASFSIPSNDSNNELDSLKTLSDESNFDHVQFSIYPNPTSNSLNFKILGIPFSTLKDKPIEVKIIDNLGQILLSSFIGESKGQFDVSNLQPGIYSVVFFSNSVKCKKKLVKID
jgi:Zn-dependent metalloprotease